MRKFFDFASSTGKKIFPLPHRTMVIGRLCAFTLAEVLITLTVIGVVAAITLPSLIQNYQKQVLVNQLKKEYSVVSQAIQKMMADEGVDNFRDTEFYTSVFHDHDNGKNILNRYFKTLNIEYSRLLNKYKIFTVKRGYSPDESNDTYIIYLQDGAIVFLNGYLSLFIDVNGEKGPNIQARDLFRFVIDSNGKLVPEEKGILEYDSNGQGHITEVPGAARIMQDGWKMNY